MTWLQMAAMARRNAAMDHRYRSARQRDLVYATPSIQYYATAGQGMAVRKLSTMNLSLPVLELDASGFQSARDHCIADRVDLP